jgi:hypothetical protein
MWGLGVGVKGTEMDVACTARDLTAEQREGRAVLLLRDANLPTSVVSLLQNNVMRILSVKVFCRCTGKRIFIVNCRTNREM